MVAGAAALTVIAVGAALAYNKISSSKCIEEKQGDAGGVPANV